MPISLDLVKKINDVTGIEINSFSVDIGRKEIHIGYSEIDAQNNSISEKMVTITEPDFTTTIVDASANAGADIYSALKSSLYNQLKLITGESGVVR